MDIEKTKAGLAGLQNVGDGKVGIDANMPLMQKLINGQQLPTDALSVIASLGNNAQVKRNLGTGDTNASIGGNIDGLAKMLLYGGISDGDIGGGLKVNVDDFYGEVGSEGGTNRYNVGYDDGNNSVDLGLTDTDGLLKAMLSGKYRLNNNSELFGSMNIDPRTMNADNFRGGLNIKF